MKIDFFFDNILENAIRHWFFLFRQGEKRAALAECVRSSSVTNVPDMVTWAERWPHEQPGMALLREADLRRQGYGDKSGTADLL